MSFYKSFTQRLPNWVRMPSIDNIIFGGIVIYLIEWDWVGAKLTAPFRPKEIEDVDDDDD